MSKASASEIASLIVAEALKKPREDRRFLLAIAGPPAAGKTTVVALVKDKLIEAGFTACLLPMDGFHMDNEQLEQLDLLHRKGAPQTFLAKDFAAMVADLTGQEQVIAPGFDRAADRTVPGIHTIDAATDFVVLEGNYLLYNAPEWRSLQDHWDFSVFITFDQNVLEQRLIKRWIDFGLDQDAATKRAMSNDIPNAKSVLDRRMPSSLTFRNGAATIEADPE